VSVFTPVELDLRIAELQLAEFKLWFDENKRFSETRVVNELKRLAHLSALIGYMEPAFGKPNVYKYEFVIQGVFRADLVIGNSNSGRFVLVEFEGGQDHSIFGPRSTNQMRDWSHQLQHGFGQIVDWSWAKNDNQHTEVFKSAFGCERMSELYVLVSGRRDSINRVEASRLQWRSEKTTIGGTKVVCMTYDDLVSFFDGTLEVWRTMHK
jgi:hypothetical protein